MLVACVSGWVSQGVLRGCGVLIACVSGWVSQGVLRGCGCVDEPAPAAVSSPQVSKAHCSSDSWSAAERPLRGCPSDPFSSDTRCILLVTCPSTLCVDRTGWDERVL